MAKQNNATRRIIFWTLGIAGLLAVLGAVGWKMGWLGNKPKGVEVETALAEKKSLTQIVTASGKIQPEIEVKISPDVSGEIIELRVNEGDAVQQGELLARIKPDFYVAQVEQASAGVSQSQANMAQRKADMLKAEVDYKRQKGLFDRGVISESEFQGYQTQFEVAKAGYDAAVYAVESASARLREAREQLGKTNIYAPMTGAISQLNVELGERVVGTSQMAGTEMMRLARLEQMELEVDVNENDVVNVSVGDTALVEVDAYPERKFKGMVTEIANSARISGAGSQEQVTNFPVKVRILDPHNVDAAPGKAAPAAGVAPQPETPDFVVENAVLRPGMTGTVDVFTETVADVIAIPIQAVTVRDMNKINDKKKDGAKAGPPAEEAEDEGATETTEEQEKRRRAEDLRKVVFLMQDGKARMVQVETGISDDTHVQVRSGLKGGEQVITGPFRAVSRELEPESEVYIKQEKGGPGGKAVVASAQ